MAARALSFQSQKQTKDKNISSAVKDICILSQIGYQLLRFQTPLLLAGAAGAGDDDDLAADDTVYIDVDVAAAENLAHDADDDVDIGVDAAVADNNDNDDVEENKV